MKNIRTRVAPASFHGPVWLAAATSWLHAAAAAGGRTTVQLPTTGSVVERPVPSFHVVVFRLFPIILIQTTRVHKL